MLSNSPFVLQFNTLGINWRLILFNLSILGSFMPHTSVVSNSVWPLRWQPTRLLCPRILQARTLEWVSISFSNAWKWKVKGMSLSPVHLFGTARTAAYQTPPSMWFSRQEYWSAVPSPSPIYIYIYIIHKTVQPPPPGADSRSKNLHPVAQKPVTESWTEWDSKVCSRWRNTIQPQSNS